MSAADQRQVAVFDMLLERLDALDKSMELLLRDRRYMEEYRASVPRLQLSGHAAPPPPPPISGVLHTRDGRVCEVIRHYDGPLPSGSQVVAIVEDDDEDSVTQVSYGGYFTQWHHRPGDPGGPPQPDPRYRYSFMGRCRRALGAERLAQLRAASERHAEHNGDDEDLTCAAAGLTEREAWGHRYVDAYVDELVLKSEFPGVVLQAGKHLVFRIGTPSNAERQKPTTLTEILDLIDRVFDCLEKRPLAKRVELFEFRDRGVYSLPGIRALVRDTVLGWGSRKETWDALSQDELARLDDYVQMLVRERRHDDDYLCSQCYKVTELVDAWVFAIFGRR